MVKNSAESVGKVCVDAVLELKLLLPDDGGGHVGGHLGAAPSSGAAPAVAPRLLVPVAHLGQGHVGQRGHWARHDGLQPHALEPHALGDELAVDEEGLAANVGVKVQHLAAIAVGACKVGLKGEGVACDGGGDPVNLLWWCEWGAWG